jgi:hypothetical protein
MLDNTFTEHALYYPLRFDANKHQPPLSLLYYRLQLPPFLGAPPFITRQLLELLAGLDLALETALARIEMGHAPRVVVAREDDERRTRWEGAVKRCEARVKRREVCGEFR